MRSVSDIAGTIDRRLLLNFRVDPDVANRAVPAPFRVATVGGMAVAGICLIRLTELRPIGLPQQFGITTENVAHRFAVEWDGNPPGHGVYIPRRDTSSRLSTLIGGRLFPGVHHRAGFDVAEHLGNYAIDVRGAHGRPLVSVRAHEASALPSDSVFDRVEAASDFFRRDSVGYSATSNPGSYDGIELESYEWKLDALAVDHVYSAFFSDLARFPAGSVTFDCALSMRRTRARWIGHPQLHAPIESLVTA